MPELSRVLITLIGVELILFIAPPIFASVLPPAWARAFWEDTTPLGTTLSFGSFAVILILFHPLVRATHRRGIGSMIGPYRTAWNDYLVALAGVGAVLIAVEIAPPFIDLAELSTIRRPVSWVMWVPVALVVITVQSATEEVIYRGYLQQQMAVRSSHPVVWMVFPSVVFGGAHYFNGFGPADGILWALWAMALGLACADLTARTGSIGAAIGLHSANNIYASLIVGIEDWPATGFAMFLYPYEDPSNYDYSLFALAQPWAVFDFATSMMMVYVMWLAARVALRR